MGKRSKHQITILTYSTDLSSTVIAIVATYQYHAHTERILHLPAPTRCYFIMMDIFFVLVNTLTFKKACGKQIPTKCFQGVSDVLLCSDILWLPLQMYAMTRWKMSVSVKVYTITFLSPYSQLYPVGLITLLLFLPPATKLGQGNIFSSVCQEFCPRGESAPLHAGIPPRADPPSGSRHPSGTSSPPDQAPPGAVHAGRYGHQAGGTHPTGMQSCCLCIFLR